MKCTQGLWWAEQSCVWAITYNCRWTSSTYISDSHRQISGNTNYVNMPKLQ